MVWKCTCGAQNELYNMFCQSCTEEIPQRERNKIYRRELMRQLQECMVLVKNSTAVRFVKALLRALKKKITEVLSGTSKEDLKLAIIPVIFICIVIFNIIIQVTGRTISHSRFIREERNRYSIERRTALNENVRLKINYAIAESGFTDVDTPQNAPVKEHIEAKKSHLLEKTKIAVRNIIEYAERGYEKCRSYFE